MKNQLITIDNDFIEHLINIKQIKDENKQAKAIESIPNQKIQTLYNDTKTIFDAVKEISKNTAQYNGQTSVTIQQLLKENETFLSLIDKYQDDIKNNNIDKEAKKNIINILTAIFDLYKRNQSIIQNIQNSSSTNTALTTVCYTLLGIAAAGAVYAFSKNTGSDNIELF